MSCRPPGSGIVLTGHPNHPSPVALSLNGYHGVAGRQITVFRTVVVYTARSTSIWTLTRGLTLKMVCEHISGSLMCTDLL